MPPLWSFGTWMSRITYFSEAEGRDVARKLRENKIPSDVIHFDTGWFGVDWQCDYAFAADRFDNPRQMLTDLRSQGFRTCLWQLPYFTPKNKFFPELVERGLPTAVADCTNTTSTRCATTKPWPTSSRSCTAKTSSGHALHGQAHNATRCTGAVMPPPPKPVSREPSAAASPSD